MMPAFVRALASLLLLSGVLIVRAQNPDAIYPLPPDYGNDFLQGVNLFNGNVNYLAPLATVDGSQVAFQLTALYNGRSAALIDQSASGFYANALGGYGWKLMDYPKIVMNGSQYYFLDGYSAYPLVSTGTNSFTPGAKYYLWQVLQTGTAQFDLATPEGRHYIFAAAPVQQGSLSTWSFTTVRDALWGDSIQLQYFPSGHLNRINNTKGDTLILQYSDTAWSAGIATYSRLATAQPVQAAPDGKYLQAITETSNGSLLSLVLLAYSPIASVNGNTYPMLTAIRHYHQIYGHAYDQMGGGYAFTYQRPGSSPGMGGDNYAGALASTTDPAGAVVTYCYKLNAGPQPTYRVMQVAVNDGYDNHTADTTDPNTYTTIHYDTTNFAIDPMGIYRQYNAVEVFPGGCATASNMSRAHPFGSVQYFFLNGNPAALLQHLPAGYDSAAVTSVALTGLRYLTHINSDSSVHDPGEKVATSAWYWNAGVVAGFGTAQVLWLDKTYSTEHGVTKWLTYAYGTAYHLPVQLATVRRDPAVLSPLVNRDSVVTQLQYAFQQYPALAAPGIHLLQTTSGEIQLVQKDLRGPFTVTACHCTPWGQWTAGQPAAGGNWAPLSQITMRDSAADTSACYSVKGSTPQWLATTTYNARNTAGYVTDSSDAMGNHQSAIYGYGPYAPEAVAHFDNAAVTGQEAAYLGFEAYEGTTGWNLTGQGSFSRTFAHTGKFCFIPNTSGAPWRRCRPLRQDQPYVFSIWYRNDSTVGNISYQYFDSANNRYASGSYPLPVTHGAWVPFSFVLDFPAARDPLHGITLEADIYIFTRSANTDFAVDDLAFAPAGSRFTADVHEINRDFLTSTVGMNGQTTYYIRDRFNRLIAQQGPGNNSRISDVTLSYNSRQGNRSFTGSDRFDPVYPNMELRLNAHGNGVWESFANPATPNFPAAGLSNMQIGGNWLLTTAAPGYATFSGAIGQDEEALYTELFPNNLGAAQEAGLSFRLDSLSGGDSVISTAELKFVLTGGQAIRGGQAVRGGQAKLYYGNRICRTQSLSAIPAYNTLMVTISDNNFLIAYLNGRYLFECYFPYGRIGGPARLISTNPGAAFDNFLYLGHVQAQQQTFDALMRPRQTLVRKSVTELQVSEILYGGPMNLPVAQTRTGIIGGRDADSLGLSYKPGFASGFNYDSMTLSRTSVLGAAAGYQNPFSVSISYGKSPLLELTGIGGGGRSTAGRAGDQYARIRYGNAAGNVFDYTPDDLISVTSLGSDSGVRIEYINSDAVVFGLVSYKGKDTLKTQYEYDSRLRPVKEYEPNYYSSLAGNGRFVHVRQFDFTGHRITDSTSNEGATRYVYDALGQVRFQIDAAGMRANPDTIVYTKYDPLGRVTEQGILQGLWQRDSLQAIANRDPGYPNAGSRVKYTWRKKFRYDRYGGDRVYQGNLVSASVNNNSDTLADVNEYYWYDSAGRVAVKGLQVFDFDSVLRRVTYTYDQQGRMLTTQFPGTGHPALVYRYDEAGNLVSVGVPEDSLLYAAYNYGYSTTEYLNRGKFMRTYNYNTSGNIDSLNDPLFSETIRYDSLKGGGGSTDKMIGEIDDFNKASGQGTDAAYRYDDNGRLAVADLGASNPWSMGLRTPLSYDNDGNILSLQTGKSNPLQFAYNAGTDQINTVQGFARNYGYDADGNIVAVPYGNYNIRYDPISGRTLSMTNRSGNLLSFEYDGKDQRVLKSVTYGRDSSVQRLYVHGLNDYPLYELSRTNGGRARMTFYVYGPKGLVAIEQGANRYYVIRDYQQSTRMIIDTNNVVKASFNYSTYGSIAYSSIDSGMAGIPMNYLYTGQEYDGESGVYNYRARMYDPGSSRFYSRDPEHQYPSPYTYAGNNPVSMTDPSGTWSFWSTVAAVGVAFVAVAVVVVVAVVFAPAAVAAAAVAIGVSTGAVVSGAIGLGAVGAALMQIGIGMNNLEQSRPPEIYNPPPPSPPIVSTGDGISCCQVITAADLGISGRPFAGGYAATVDLKKASFFVNDGTKDLCPGVSCDGDSPEQSDSVIHMIYPGRPLKAGTYRKNSQTLPYRYPAGASWAEKYQYTLYINASFFFPEVALYIFPCTDIQGIWVAGNQVVSASLSTAYWSFKGESDDRYYLDALVFNRKPAEKGGKIAEAVLYDANKFFHSNYLRDDVAAAVSGICFVRHGVDYTDSLPDVVIKNSPVARTAIGINADGTQLYILQVSSSVSGVHDGTTFHEMARWFLSKGCTDVIDLDGSGSSQLYYSKNANTVWTPAMDRPLGGLICNPGMAGTTLAYRPFPVFIGFK